MLYLNSNKAFDEILLGINLDGVGYRRTLPSLYGCPEGFAESIREVFSRAGIVEGEPQGDHMLFGSTSGLRWR
jgi:hypothetical protein